MNAIKKWWILNWKSPLQVICWRTRAELTEIYNQFKNLGYELVDSKEGGWEEIWYSKSKNTTIHLKYIPSYKSPKTITPPLRR